ncbi:hypothetical protein [Heliophilum fasciatum]|uniref:SipL SPOCS domain-containing protein n=1 Tax=Heliophilum fasciatum TaxID=35700 RepID=A0A4R2RPR9_9FIRM|nr:hypothetical protein [Heliophilum fasciatum]MCW2278003.1 hypothetical protein [Heliophilum fasciatum]TCP64377.1 hypothetical protein EDD73_11076 [Heliophilum fasciatum]
MSQNGFAYHAQNNCCSTSEPFPCPRSTVLYPAPGQPVTFPDIASPSNTAQFTVMENLVLPGGFPDIHNLEPIITPPEVRINQQLVIRTPQTTSVDGTVFTGRKLAVEGHLCQMVQYTTCHTGAKHGVPFVFPFSAYIPLPTNTNLNQTFQVNAFVEFVAITATSPRTLFKNVIIFLWAVPL